ncbi:MAG: hypothetical protein ABI725_06625 [Chloroflexota bacterium]
MSRTVAITFAAALLALACGPAVPTPTPAATGTGRPASPLATLSPSASSGPTQSPAPTQLEIEVARLTSIGGCGDVFIQAITADGTAAITIQWGGAATAAWADREFNETAQIPDGQAKVFLVVGHELTRFYCTDIGWPGAEEVTSTPAITGSVELVVRPDRARFRPAGSADLRLSDVSFKVMIGSEEEIWHLDELVIENVPVGWLAG